MALASIIDRPPTPPAIAAQDRSAPGRVTGKLLVALRAMVWKGLKRVDAATEAGMSEHSLYAALRKPHVRQWYLAELEVLRTSERARNIFTLAEVRDQVTNQMARVQAVKALEQLEDSPTSSSVRMQAPGFVIQVINQQPSPMPHRRTTDANPLIEHTSGRHDEEALPNQGDADR